MCGRDCVYALIHEAEIGQSGAAELMQLIMDFGMN